MRPPELIETTRLRLRLPTLADARFVFDEYAQDTEVTRYLDWEPHADIGVTQSFMARCEGCWREETAFPWVMERRQDEIPMGMIEMRVAGARADFGYVLGRRFWGNGYMPEAVVALRDWALAQPSIHRFWAVCDVDNHASARVLEKAGLAREGILRRWGAHPAAGRLPRDCSCYAAVKQSSEMREVKVAEGEQDRMMVKIAPTDHPIHALISDRWSPYGFTDRKVAPEDLRSLFEAARWAPSCYNEQPWRFIVATSDDAPGFARLLSCLVDANQAWARHAPVLALGVARRTFTRNDRVNRHALYDLGQAVANLSVEATERGLAVHQMGGILPERARELYLVPDEFEIVTGIAIGHAGAGTDLPDDYRQRDATPRVRSSLESFVFADRWEVAAGMVVDD